MTPDLGVLLYSDYTTRELVELGELSEALGYRYFWYTDVRFARECYLGLAAVAARTKRIHLGTGVTDPYSRHPAITAAAIATLDEMSEGRAVLGLGTGGFSIAAGFGERRGLYPHNHALEALAEGGLPGFALWLLAFGGGLLVALLRLRRAEPAAAARIAAMVLPVAMATMVSSDLGNRMAWFALGLALSLGVAARLPERAHV